MDKAIIEKTRVCKRCGKRKKIDRFPITRSKSGKVSHRRECKECRQNYHRDWAAKNKEYIQEYRRKYHKEHREEIIKKVKEWAKNNRARKLAYQRAWYLLNQERLKLKQKRYYEAHIEEARKYREDHKKYISKRMKKWRENHKKDILEYMMEWRRQNEKHIKEYGEQYRKEHPEVKRLSEQKRRARKRGKEGDITADHIMGLLSLQECQCIYCGRLIKTNYTIDHVTPLSRGGEHDISNLQLLCKSCNSKKGAKTDEEYRAILAMREN